MKLLLANLIIYFLGAGRVYAEDVFNIWRGTGKGGETCNVGGPCNLCDALIVVQNVVTLLFTLATPLAVGMIIYGAIRLMIAGGSKEQMSSAKKIITNAVLGLIIALSAWVIVNEVLHLLTGRLNYPWADITCSR
jgi:hypothetical protein